MQITKAYYDNNRGSTYHRDAYRVAVNGYNACVNEAAKAQSYGGTGSKADALMDGVTGILGIGIDYGGKAFDLDTGCVSDGWHAMLRELDELHHGDINSAIYSAYQTQKQLQEESANAASLRSNSSVSRPVMPPRPTSRMNSASERNRPLPKI